MQEDLNNLLDNCAKVKLNQPKQYKVKKPRVNNSAKQPTKFQCKFCDRICRSQDGLDKHYEEYCEKIHRNHNYGRYGNDSSEDSSEEEIFECEYCGKQFDSLTGCQFHTNVHCKKKNKKYKNNYGGSSNKKKKYSNNCKRCGREGHYASDCYASTHDKGYYLD